MRPPYATLLLAFLLSLASAATAQAPSTDSQATSTPGSPPVPIELMAGSAYASINVVLSKALAPQSRWGVFHQNTLVAGYHRDDEDDVAMQSLLTFAAAGSFRITAGAFYGSIPGVSPTVGMQYLGQTKQWFILVSPRVNVEADPSYSVFSVLRYTRGMVYLSMQGLNTFDSDRHIKSYQWLRLGIDLRGTQLGLGMNFDEAGPKPRVESSLGAFVRRPVF
jgi:hypothetical protein